jgi:hypothetical protein
MKYAIISAENAIMFQHYKEGCNMVEFREMLNGKWAAPFEVSLILPAAFPDMEIKFLTEQDFI